MRFDSNFIAKIVMKVFEVSSVFRSAFKQTVVLLVIAILFNLMSYDVWLLLGHISRLWHLRRIVHLNHRRLLYAIDVTTLLIDSLLALKAG